MRKIVIISVLVLSVLTAMWWLIDRNKNNKKIDYLDENHYSEEELVKTFDKNKINKVNKIQAVITSHHFLAKDLIAKTLAIVDEEKIEEIILVSPDHFKQIKKRQCLILTDNIGWETDFGKLEPESSEINKINKNQNVCTDFNSFRGEHGIYTLVPFLKNYFPKAKIVPLILKPKNNFEDFYNLGKEIANDFDKNKTLMVISSDFSHYVTESVANKQDEKSVEILKNKNKEKISLMENDCRQCVAFLFGYLGEKPEFNLIKISNSFEISGENKDYVTSYVTGYYR